MILANDPCSTLVSDFAAIEDRAFRILDEL
jgi:hypothetical protein